MAKEKKYTFNKGKEINEIINHSKERVISNPTFEISYYNILNDNFKRKSSEDFRDL